MGAYPPVYGDDPDQFDPTTSQESGTAASTSSQYFNMTESERRIWNAWKSSSSNQRMASIQLAQDEAAAAEYKQKRDDAKNDLLEYANKAAILYGGRNSKAEEAKLLSTRSPKTVRARFFGGKTAMKALGKRMQDEEKSAQTSPRHVPKWLSKNDLADRAIKSAQSLEHVSSVLNNEGLEVLKLGRSNKWQLRYLALSSDVLWLSNCDSDTGNVGQCPKALLWLKRRTDSRDRGLTNLKKQGRGGLLFSNMNNIQLVKKESTSASGTLEHISKKLKASFSAFHAVSVDYSFDEDDGTDTNRSVMFCFKNEEDAEAFIDAMKIIRNIIMKERVNERPGVIYQPTE